MTITLKELNQDNWEYCIDLKVYPQQEKFVASNLYSIAEAQFIEGCVPLAIYNDEILVGFIMYEPDLENQTEKAYFITRLMIDSAYQGKGYAREAVQQVIQRLKESTDCRVIKTSYVPENTVAEKLYYSLGFIPTGEVEYGEIILQMIIPN